MSKTHLGEGYGSGLVCVVSFALFGLKRKQKRDSHVETEQYGDLRVEFLSKINLEACLLARLGNGDTPISRASPEENASLQEAS